MALLPPSAHRVPRNTPTFLQRHIRNETKRRLREVARRPGAASQRLKELDAEWDVERALEATASSFAVFGSAMALRGSIRWAFFPLVVAGFLLQHALQGWCPPLLVFRALGFRTRREIDDERHALKALRGDYRSADRLTRSPESLLEASERA
jgi:hypothetical protein